MKSIPRWDLKIQMYTYIYVTIATCLNGINLKIIIHTNSIIYPRVFNAPIEYVKNISVLIFITTAKKYLHLGRTNNILYTKNALAVKLPNFLNGIIHLSFLELSIISFGYIKMWIWSWPASSIKPGQTARMCRLAWLYTSGKAFTLLVPAG